MNLLLAAVAVLVLALGGVGGLRLVWAPVTEAPRTARLALGFCTGTFLVSVIFFAAYLGGVAFSRWLVLGPLGTLALVGSFVMRPRAQDDGLAHEKPWLAGLLVVVALALSWSRPIHGYDAVMMWGLKAKMMFFAHTWPLTMFDPFTTAHTEYPPMVPSAQAFVFFWLGEFDDVASRVVFVAWFAAGAGILWWLLGQLRASSRTMWLLWWCAVPVAMQQVDLTYADLPLAVYSFVFYGALAAWLRKPAKRHWLWLAGVFGGMAFWVKQDAMIGIGAGLAALLVMTVVRACSPKPPHPNPLPRRGEGTAAGFWLAFLQTLLVVALVAAPYRLFVWIRNLPNDFTFAMTGIPAKTVMIASSLFHYLMVEGGFVFFWPVILLTLAFRWRRVREPATAWLLGSALIFVLLVFGIYWCAKDDLTPLLKTSMERVLIGLFVPGLLLGAQLWRGRFKVLRWQFEAFIVGVVAVGLMGWLGYQSGGGKLLEASVEFPLGLSLVWVTAGILMLWKLWPMVRRHGVPAIWRTVQFAVVVATMGLAVVAASIHAGTSAGQWEQFKGKTLVQQHIFTVPPPLGRQIGMALNKYPPGTHVQALPKRSLWHHIFYYETFPDLVMDNLSTNVIRLTSQ